MKIKCNGYNIPRKRFTESVEVLVKREIDKQRPIFKQECPQTHTGQGIHYGTRFKDNDSVLLRISSACNGLDATVLSNLRDWVWAGLEECAHSDYWYRYEKDWGME